MTSDEENLVVGNGIDRQQKTTRRIGVAGLILSAVALLGVVCLVMKPNGSSLADNSQPGDMIPDVVHPDGIVSMMYFGPASKGTSMSKAADVSPKGVTSYSFMGLDVHVGDSIEIMNQGGIGDPYVVKRFFIVRLFDDGTFMATDITRDVSTQQNVFRASWEGELRPAANKKPTIRMALETPKRWKLGSGAW